jgi:hypothetical protein
MARRSHGGFTFVWDDGAQVVWVYSGTENLGGWLVSRYADGIFGAEWMRQFVAEIEAKTRGG